MGGTGTLACRKYHAISGECPHGVLALAPWAPEHCSSSVGCTPPPGNSRGARLFKVGGQPVHDHIEGVVKGEVVHDNGPHCASTGEQTPAAACGQPRGQHGAAPRQSMRRAAGPNSRRSPAQALHAGARARHPCAARLLPAGCARMLRQGVATGRPLLACPLLLPSPAPSPLPTDSCSGMAAAAAARRTLRSRRRACGC